MKKIAKKIIVILIILSFLFIGSISIFAQKTSEEQEIINLEKQLKELEELEKKIAMDVTATQAERERIQYQVSTIKRRIDQLQVEVRQAQSRAQVLTGQIKDKEVSINVTIREIEDLRNKLTLNLREIHEEDQKSLIEVLISENDLSGFFDNSLNLERLSMKTRNLLGEIVTLKVNLEEEKTYLGQAKNETEQLAELRAAQAREAEQLRKNQEVLLRDTQQKEAVQQQELQEVRKQAAEIRSRIFELAGMPVGIVAPTFGEAYEIAKWVEGITGVRPAFLLAVLQQESRIGQNVGRCHLSDLTSGATYNINTGQVFTQGIHVTRDLPPFLQITGELNLDPLKTSISCQIPSVGGYGGAMGPAQFIPSTWMAYRERLARILVRPANPWNIRDAFLASGLYLSDYGARAQTRDAEWCAAQGYFTGRKCNPNNAFYGNNVLAIADGFQRDINILIQSR